MSIFGRIILALFCTTTLFAAEPEIRRETAFQSEDRLFLQARSVVYPDGNSGARTAMITMSSYGVGTHAYGDIYTMKSDDLGKNWSQPKKVPALKKEAVDGGMVRVFGDITPDWHEKSRTVLCTGKSFFFKAEDAENTVVKKRVDLEEMQEIAYAVYDPKSDSWTSLQTVALPSRLKNGDDFIGVNSGCSQRVDLPDGDVLLPIRYRKGKNIYITTVLRCGFDGKTLKYKDHGSTHTISVPRGLYEASIAEHGGKFFLTLRGDKSAFVARSEDGLHFSEPVEWTFSDGSILGSYNTQQHWISRPDGLYLVYTRKGADNDHIFRHRAPLLLGKVDPEKLHVIRETEQTLIPIPEGNGDTGNFGITRVDDAEFWATVAVCPPGGNGKQSLVIFSRVLWK